MAVKRKTSLSAGAAIRSVLLEDPEVARRTSKVFPITVEKAELPYIVYRRSSLETRPQKSGQPGSDTVEMEIICYTRHYGEGVELAEAVRSALDFFTISYEGQQVSGYLSGSEESYQDDAFVQLLIFTLRV